MENNIIFFLFVVLLILVILWLSTTTKEGFETDATTAVGSVYDSTTAPSNFSNVDSTSSGTFYNTGSTTYGGSSSSTFYDITSDSTNPPMDYGTTTPGGFVESGTTTPGGFVESGTTTPGGFVESGTTAPGGFVESGTTVPNNITQTSGFVQSNTTTPGTPSDCQYTWSNWGACDLASGNITRTVATVPPRNGGAACTTPPPNSTVASCLNIFNFSNIKTWTRILDPPQTRNSPYSISVFTPNPKKNIPDTLGFKQSSLVPSSYVRVRFDNTSNAFTDFEKNPKIALQNKIVNLPPGNYLLSYYVQSRVSDIDTQSISIYAAYAPNNNNNTTNDPFFFRTTDGQSLIQPGTWVKQNLAFTVFKEDPASTMIQLVFELFDTQTTSDNAVAIGGFKLQSCGEQPCNIDCTYIYGDWSYCDFPSGESTRTIFTLPPVNKGAVCSDTAAAATRQKCFDSINFANTDLSKSGWTIIYNPATITQSVNMLVTSAEKDTKFKFDNSDATFNTPYTIVNFDNTNGNLSTFSNTNIIMQTTMKLAPGNYRMTYFLQSWDSLTDTQSITVNSVFGTTKNIFNFKNTVAPGVWFPQSMEFTVGTATPQPIFIKFQFILKDRTKGTNHAVALGGIQMFSCGEDACPVDCQYVWDYWQPCDKTTNTTYRDALVLTYPDGNGAQCPARDVSNCSVIPQDCKYSWGDWSTCTKGSKTRTRTQITVTPGPHGKRCNAPQTETISGCNDCEIETSWTACTQKCGPEKKEKTVHIKTPQSDGGSCDYKEGQVLETADCGNPDCEVPIDCEIETQWSTCTQKCGKENKQRTIHIKTPANSKGKCQYNGKDAYEGQVVETADCGNPDCVVPADCKYNGWSEYSACVAGNPQRKRTAITVPPSNGGKDCTPGVDADTTLNDCPVDCNIISQKNPVCNSKEGYVYYDVKIQKKNGAGNDCTFGGKVITDDGKYKSDIKCADCKYDKVSYCDGTNKHDVITITQKAEKGGSCNVKEGDNKTNKQCSIDIKKTFRDNDTWTAPFTGPIQLLIVGGGGGGGTTGRGIYEGGGGGGGGGVGEGTVNVVKGKQYKITVGKGGKGGSSNGIGTGQNGENSSFVGDTISEIAYGGGGGGGAGTNTNTNIDSFRGADGGSGGGGSGSWGDRTGGKSFGGKGTIKYYGTDGATGYSKNSGGGGGGCSSLLDGNPNGSDGGNGRNSWSGIKYGAGGGGGSGISGELNSSTVDIIRAGHGGKDGGGDGAGSLDSHSSRTGDINTTDIVAGNGIDGTGGGGGGGRFIGSGVGGNGGSGVVIIAY